MTDLADHRHDPHHLLGPEETRRRCELWIKQGGTWVDGMQLVAAVGVLRTLHYVNGVPYWTPHLMHPLGPSDPYVDLGMLRDALAIYERRLSIDDLLR